MLIILFCHLIAILTPTILFLRSSNAPELTQQEASNKLKSDLKIVMDKARLCREMLPESKGIATDVALSEVVGYLEACRTRLMDLIEAGTMGMLDEDVLELALKTNDVVNRTLEAEMVAAII